jgi:AcrR family transcriptional regulator
MARKPAPDTRERILESAGRLFRAHGVRAVGMQQIIDECGCGKNLLYREFASKDELVAAFLQRCQQEWTALMDDATQPHAGDAAGELVALVRAAVEQVAAPDFRSCPFRATLAEFPDADHPAHRVAVEHAENLRSRLRGLTGDAGAADPHALADQLMLVIDGVYINGAMLGPRGAATAAVGLAKDLIARATSPGVRVPAGVGPGSRRRHQ